MFLAFPVFGTVIEILYWRQQNPKTFYQINYLFKLKILILHSMKWLLPSQHIVIESQQNNIRAMSRDVALMLFCWLSTWFCRLVCLPQFIDNKFDIFLLTQACLSGKALFSTQSCQRDPLQNQQVAFNCKSPRWSVLYRGNLIYFLITRVSRQISILMIWQLLIRLKRQIEMSIPQ